MTIVQKKRKMQKSNGQDDSFPSHAYFVDRDFVTQAEFKPVVDKVNKISEENVRIDTKISGLIQSIENSAKTTEKDMKRIEDNLNSSTKSISDKLDSLSKITTRLSIDRAIVIGLFSLLGVFPVMHYTGVIRILSKYLTG